MQKKISIILLLTTIMVVLGSCSINARIKKADKKYAIGEYYEASDLYRQTYKRIPTKDKKLRAHVAFRQAESQRILNNSQAASAYKNAIRYKPNEKNINGQQKLKNKLA